MKPIKLTIAGLHSFRETQEISFEELSDTGVFGIFGPTGSGKSTILDAMTLALYGSVGRAEHNTRGILNHAEKTLTVAFEFEIGTNPRRRYRAERMYRRRDELSVQNVRSRFIECSPAGDIVLADKDSEVTAQVKRVLGLEPEDFTRAVVLPQGKFAEFLYLKGADRNKMLQRLFSLEKYGDGLQQKVKARLEAAEREMAVLAAEQLGLGDASADAVEAAKATLADAQNAEQAAMARLTDARTAMDQARAIWEKQQQLADIEAQLRAYEQQADQVRQWERTLEAAARARLVAPFIQAASEGCLRMQQADSAYRQLAAQAEVRKAETESLRQAWERAKAEQQTQEPQLRHRQKELEEALLWEQEWRALSKELEAFRKEHAELTRKQTQLRNEVAELEQTLAAAAARKAELQGYIRERTVSPGRRLRVQSWRQLTDHYVHVRREWEESGEALADRSATWTQTTTRCEVAEATLRALEQEAAEVQSALEQHEAIPHRALDDVRRAEADLQRIRDLLRQMESVEAQKDSALQAQMRWASELQERTDALAAKIRDREQWEAQVAELERRRDAVQQQMAAALLASGLRDGEPCPVCGSAAHPQPAHVHDRSPEVMAQVTADLDAARGALESAKNEAHSLERLRMEAEAALRQAESSLQAADGTFQDVQIRVRDIRDDAHVANAAALRAWVDAEAKRLAADEQAAQQWMQAHEALTERRQATRDAANEQRIVVASLASEAKSLREEVDRLERQRQAAETRLLEAKQRLEAELVDAEGVPDLDVQSDAWTAWLQRQVDEIAADDELVDGAKREVDQLEAEMARLAAEQNRQNAKLTEVQVAVAQVEVEVRGRAERVKSLESAIRERAGEQSPAVVLETVQQTLQKLSDDVATAEAAYRESEETLRTMEKDVAVARTRLEQLTTQYERAEAALAEKLREHQFVTVAEAEDAMLDDAEFEERQARVQAYANGMKRLEAQREPLLAQLGDTRIQPEEWQQVQERLADADRRWKDAVSAVGAAQEALTDVCKRHESWKKLEARRVQCAELVGQLTTLRQVLSGNRFVEFVAEEQLEFVAQHASERLKQLTRNRYALELSADGRFVMRDDFNGGVRRPATTLSGGETFLTSLSLALALSTQIQLQGQYPLEFFFLDEGFGTLDPELLDVVMNTLEKLHMENMTIGVISHVPELRQRLQRRLVVHPAEPAGRGTRVSVERA
jgi:DNA repair protein SbcC/Rad50